MFLYNMQSGGACTGTIIAPRLVLTAKHCVEGSSGRAASPSGIRIYVGTSTRSFTSEYRVSEVRTAPGCWDLCGDASDVAVVMLSEPAREAPMPVSFEAPGSLAGRTITAVGFGQTPTGSSGTKYVTMKRVTFVTRGLIYVEPTVCSGDSGGPVIGADGAVYGVASFITSADGRTEPRCGTAPGAYNEIARWQDFIETAIEDSGTCIPDGAEICNGADDDCNGAVDETCTPIGAACAGSMECIGGLCADTASGRICTQTCDPLRPSLGCSPGMYCASAGGCDGYCVPGTGGTATIGADCTSHGECASLLCVDPGDGRRRCLTACRGDAGMCLAGEVCAAGAGTCGACVDADIVIGDRGLGEACARASECTSAMCFDDEGVRYCSRACADDAACGSGFHCRAGTCARGVREGTGGACVTNDDCDDGGFCAARGDVTWCTRVCDIDGDCPLGFACEVASGETRVCAPTGSLLGERCGATDAGCLTGLCIEAGHGDVCSRYCSPDAPCGPGFLCRRIGDGLEAVCVAPEPRKKSGGCAAGSPGNALATVLLALVGLGVSRSVRRRRGG